MQGCQDGNAQLLVGARHGCLFAAPFLFAHAQNNRAGIGDERGVKGKDGVGEIGLVFVMIDHFRAAFAQRTGQGIVLLLRNRQVGPCRVMPFLRISRAKGRVGAFHKHGAQRRYHILAAVSSGHA